MRFSPGFAGALLCATVFIGPAAWGQDAYPNRPITIVNPLPPGGTTDLVARALAPVLEKQLGQPVLVENRSGAAGAVGTAFVANAKPDGYTLLLTQTSLLLIPEADKALGRQPTFTVPQFEPLARFTADPIVVAVQSENAIQNAKALIKQIQDRPGQMTYSSSGVFGPMHVPMEMFLRASGGRMRHVPTNGGGPAITALLGGHVDIGLMVIAGATSQVKAGKIRPVVVLGAERNSAFPEVPSSAELGFPIDFTVWTGLFAPAKTPDAVLAKLSAAVSTAANDPVFKEAMEHAGTQMAYQGRDDFRAYLAKQLKDVSGAVAAIGPGNTPVTADTQTGLRNQIIAGAALSLIGLGAIGLSLQYPLGDANEPGPAYYPLILSVLLSVFGAMVIWKGDDTRLQLTEWWENGRPLAILVALCTATLLLEPLGFRLTTAAMLIALLGVLERRDWRMVLSIAIAFPVATYALLHNALKINLPLGPFGI